ncbi:hypothetical protein [Marinomonas atlantica]|uniref:hypothetical protein n=1 Tax=Marinomonas atlantica TaxID=1806668 RepID=UPI000831E351|nr:hypothetical protein [Marinomonas atlantica]
MKEKVWVFERLVKNDQDAQGLLAYALYKYSKHSLALSLRSEGVSEPEIDKRVKNFHDDQIASYQLSTYKDRADVYLDAMIKQVEADSAKHYAAEIQVLKKQHATEIQTLKSQHKKGLEKAERDLLKNVIRFREDKRTTLSKFGFWLLSGVPSALAALIVTAIFYVVMFFVVQEQTKKDVLLEGMQKISGMELETKKETP